MYKPLISVIVPMYNIEYFVKDTIQSVLSQSYSKFELILVDDCSNDRTVEVVKKFNDTRIHLLQNTENMGAGKSRNRGIEFARGEVIAFLDGDDLWKKDKLKLQLDFMQENHANVVYTRYDVINVNGVIYADSGKIPKIATYHKLLRHCFIRTSSLVYNIKGIGQKVYFPDIRKRQDFILFLSLIKLAGKAELLDEVTCSYRLHENGISANKKSVIPYQWAAYRYVEKLSFLYSAFLMSNWFIRAGFVVLNRKLKHTMKIDN